MLGLKGDTSRLNISGQSEFKILEDLSTRVLQTVSVGEEAGKISRGEANAFVGYQAGKQNTIGSFGVFVGFQAGQLNQNSDYNTFIGAFAGRENNRGFRNTFVGFQAGQLNKDGSDCTSVGAYALRENTTGNKNVAVGNRAGERILDGDNNTMIGMESGQDIRSGNNNTMAGYRSGRASFRNNENTYFGAYAGYSNSYGDGNAFVGYRAGQNLTRGNFNVAVGIYALSDAQFGDCNIAIGAFAGANISGSNNVFVGSGAGSTNNTGDNNTLVGANAGYNSQGSDNVYIGKDVAYSLTGNQNVVIGVQAYQDIESSSSVIIGYRAGNNIFNFGNSNILIGINADTYTERTNNAIVIGSKNTKAYNNSISVGENIDNGGENSVSLGYDLSADGDKIISVGNQIDIKGVNVFNDPLNYRFPVKNTQNYDKFGFIENYSDTLYLKGVSNEIAIATLNTSNEYDSYTNIQRGTALTTPRNLLHLFTYNILYQGRSFFYDGITPTVFNITDYFLDPNNSNNFRTTGFDKSNLFLNSANEIINYGVFDLFESVNTSNESYNITIDGQLLPYLINNNISSNLIPYQTTAPIFQYEFSIVKRNSIYKTYENSNYYIPFENPLSIYTTSNKVVSSGEVDNLPFIIYDRFEYLDTEPLYGSYSNHTYKHFKGAYFTSNDRLKIGIVNKIQGSNTYYIVSSNEAIHTHYINYNSNYTLYINSNVYVFPNKTTIIDRSYFHIHPSSNIYVNLFNSNVSNMYLSVDNTINESFSNVYFNNSLIELTPFTLSNLDPVDITLGNTTYAFHLIYQCNLQVPNVTRDTLTMSILPHKLKEYTITDFRFPSSLLDIGITKYPSYGTVAYASNAITYTPGIINIDQDNFTLLCKYENYEAIYYDVTVTTSNVFSKVLLTKMQEPISTTLNATQFNNSITVSSNITYFQTFYTYSNVTSNYPYGDSNSVGNSFINVIGSYNSNIGYIYSSNDYILSIYTETVKPIYLAIPNSNEVINNIGNDYFIYNPYPPYNYITHYYFSSNIPITTSNVITYNQYEVRSNNAYSFNRYYNWNYSIESIKYYTQACNITIPTITSNTYTDYHDLYENFIYTSSNVMLDNLGSNYFIIPTTINLQKVVSYSNISTVNCYISSNIPTIQLNRASIYQYNGSYEINTNTTATNLVILQKNIGPITRFHQSNINQQAIHIWNTQQSDTLHTTQVRSNIYFTDDKVIEIDYFKNDETVLTLTGSSTNPYFINYTQQEYTFRYQNTYDRIAIQHTSNVTFAFRETIGSTIIYNSITTLNPTLGDIYVLPDSGYKEDGFVDYINYYVNPSTGVISYGKPVRTIIPATYLKNTISFYNTAFTYSPLKYITSNELYYYKTNPIDLYFEIDSDNANFSLKKNNSVLQLNDVFYQQDITENTIFIDFKNPNPVTDAISIKIYDDGNLLETISFTATPCNIIEYIELSSNEALANMTFLDLKNTYQQTITGSQWNNLALLNSNIEASFSLTRPPQKGFLSRSNIQPITYMSFSNLVHDTFYYIPYIPMQYENDTMTGVFIYNGTLSPEYTFTLKNYRSIWNDIVVTQPDFNTQTIPRSLGMIEDNITWSPSTILFLSPGLSNISLQLNYNTVSVTDTIYYFPITKQPSFIQTSNTIQVDFGNYNSLQSLLTCLNDPIQDVIFYIIDPPLYGVLLDNFEAKSYITSSNIRVGNGFYQHYGSCNLPDQFTLRVGTTPYDVSLNTCTVNVNVVDHPYLLKNNYQYNYFNTLSAMSNTYQLLNLNILQLSEGQLVIYEKNYIDIVRSNISQNTYVPISTITKQDLDNSIIYYRPTESFFMTGSNLNQPLQLKFTVNSSNNIDGSVNKLTRYNPYKNLYDFSWIAKINIYESFNILELRQRPNQTISYFNSFNNNASSNVFRYDTKTEFLIDFKPFQQLLKFPDNPSDVKRYFFTFELTDKTNSNLPLLKGIFSHSNISIYSSNNQTIELPLINFDNTTWNTFNIVNYDPQNNDRLSIKLNDVNYTPDLNLTNIRLHDLKDIIIDVPVLNDNNYFNTILETKVNTSNLDIASNLFYYNLTNYNTQIHFKNFNVYVSGNIDINSINANNDNLFNIAIGDQLNITGINNICIGKNFITKGEGSIILGTDIGINEIDGTITNNEIFSSIIISNDSFRNSIVRDVISIGNNILNDISAIDIEQFLAQKPVLIGNDITVDKLDFHINLQNTFLKTNNNIGKIYCGLQQEEVYIGYASNIKTIGETLTDYQLHVNGGLEINGLYKQTTNNVVYKKYIYGDVLFTSGTIHTYTKNISWDNEQSTDYYPIILEGKFKCINNNDHYIWERFELLISSKNDILSQKPKLLSIVDLVGYNTTDINTFSINIVKTSSKSIGIELSIRSSYSLSDSDYITGTLELDFIYQTELGNITISTLEDISDATIFSPTFRLVADRLTGPNNSIVSSWNNILTYAVGGASLPILKTNENQRYVRLGTGIETSVTGNYLDLGTYTWSMLTNGGFTYFGVCRPYTTELYNDIAIALNLFEFGTFNNGTDNTLQLTELYQAGIQELDFYINKPPSFTNTDYILYNRYYSTRPGTQWGLYGVRIDNTVPDQHTVTLYTPHNGTYIVTRTGDPNYTFPDTFITSNNFIGKSLFSYGNYQNIDIKEVLWYDKYLDDNQVNEVISYLNTQYNLNRVGLLDSIALPSRINSYSLRLLYNSYTGPLLRVRRSTDNKEAEVYFDKDGVVTQLIPLDGDTALYGADAITTYKGNGNLYVHTWFDQMYTNDLQNLNTDEQPLLDTTDMYIYLNNTSNTINRFSYNNNFSLDNGTFIMDIKPIVHVDFANISSVTEWYLADPIITGEQSGGTDDFGIVLQQGNKFTLGLGPTDGEGVYTYTNGFNVQSIMAVSRTNENNPDTILLYKDGGLADRINRTLYDAEIGIKTSLNPGYIGYDTLNESRANVKLKTILYFNEGITVTRSTINQITRSLGHTIHNISGLTAWYDANSFDITTNTWYDMSQNDYTITSSDILGTINKGIVDNIYTLYGDTSAGIRFPADILPETYTLFHVAKYNGTNKGRIFDGDTENWFSGFWNSTIDGPLSGVAFHDGWLTDFTIDRFGTDWVISTDQNTLYRGNKTQWSYSVPDGNSSKRLTINNGFFRYNSPTELSDWAVAEVIVYNRTLTLSEIEIVENYLYDKYKPTVTPGTANVYVLFGAYNVGYFFGYGLDYSNYDRMTFTPNETDFWISTIRGLRCLTSYLTPTLESTKTTYGIEFLKPDGTAWAKGALGSSNKFYMRIRNGSNAGKIIRIQDYDDTVESGTLQADTDPGVSRGEQYYFYFTSSHDSNWYYLRSIYNDYAFIHNYGFIRPTNSTPVQTVDDAFLWMIV